MRTGDPFRDENPDAAPILDLNTTPLIDVMLVLLVMLIVTIPLALHDVKLQVGDAALPSPETAPLVVAVAADGAICWGGHRLDGEEGLDRLMAEARDDGMVVRLRADRDAPWRSVAGVMAAATRQSLARFEVQDGGVTACP